MLYHAGVCGRIVRQTRRIFQVANVALETPYLDDRVVETALAVRLRDCGHPGRYKPLLTEAMTGIVPHSTWHAAPKASSAPKPTSGCAATGPSCWICSTARSWPSADWSTRTRCAGPLPPPTPEPIPCGGST
ncbi:asparagine synthase-related protein [Nocardia amikacinitolerans]